MIKLFISVVLLGFSSLFYTQNNSTNTTKIERPIYHKARIYYGSTIGLTLLANQGVPLDHCKHKKGIYVESDFSENELAIAKMLSMQVEVLINDVSNFYVQQNKDLSPNSFGVKNGSCSSSGSPTYATPSNWELGSMGGFYTYNEMLSELDDMVNQYPNLITAKAPISNFQTFEGRDIYWLKISDNPTIDEPEPEMLYDAIHHAREPCAMQQLIYYMWYLLENYATNPEVQAIVDNTELYFIPVLNPDGFVYNCTQDPNGGGMWRKNRRNHNNGNYGVDNNRNYDYIDPQGNSVWGTTGISFNTSSDVYPGSGPFSEVENQAMKWFCENHEFKLAMNNHTYDNSLLFPYGYDNNQFTPDHTTYLAISGMMTEYNGLGMIPKISASLYPASGDSDDWMYGADLATKPKIFAFTPEIGDNGFWPPANDIETICNSMVYTNLTAAHLITNYASLVDGSPLTVDNTSGYFLYELQRLGLEDPSNFTVSINPISSNIVSVGGSNGHNNLSLLQVVNDSISFQLIGSIALGDVIEYELVVDNGQYLESYLVSKIYGTPTNVLTDNGNNLANWTVSQTWNTTTNDYYSPSSSITDSPNGNYSNNINKSITLNNAVDLTNAVGANMTFWAKWEIEDNWDYVQVEVSTDGGSTWTPQCGKYTNEGGPDQNAANGEPLYDGFQTSWVKEEINLSDYLGMSILVRFKIIADQGVREDGFYFDDFQINIITGCLNNSYSTINENACNSYTSPSGVIYNTSGTYTDIIPNAAGCDSIITINLSITAIDTTVTQNGSTLSVAPTPFAAYQWFDCDLNQPIIGQTNMIFNPTNSGNYAVEVSVNGCVLMSSCYYIDMTSISNGVWAGITTHPNPVGDVLSIEIPNLTSELEITVFDAQSKLMEKLYRTNSTTVKLDCSSYSSGFYFVKLKTEDSFYNFKIVKD
ncbi:MAG: hypothetical protein CL853_00225 [Crocinitomicaceae bacterium]|nr:hypothetical protein [Crocinitomicaceae bacterium]